MSVVMLPKRSGRAQLFAAAMCLILPGSVMSGGTARSATALEERKLPMVFTWHAEPACVRECRGWIGAVGVITAETPAKFEEFSSGHDLKGSTVVLNSSGGSVLDAITLGRRWRGLGLHTTVGTVSEKNAADRVTRAIVPEAACESMCAFLLLSGQTRTVPDGAHVRVHQIWMGDRADDAKAASYSAEDMMIVERDIGRLAKYTFEMGGTGDLLSLALSVPPWEPLHELSAEELRLTNLVTGGMVADAAVKGEGESGASKRFQDRAPSDAGAEANAVKLAPATRTAEAGAPTGGAAPAPERK